MPLGVSTGRSINTSLFSSNSTCCSRWSSRAPCQSRPAGSDLILAWLLIDECLGFDVTLDHGQNRECAVPVDIEARAAKPRRSGQGRGDDLIARLQCLQQAAAVSQ